MKIPRSFSHLFVVFFSIVVFFVQGGEYAFHLSDRLFDEGDSILNAWILAWDAYALFNPELSVWDTPMFYPVKNTLAFSENLLGNLWITMPIQWWTGNHVLAANCLALVSFILGSYFVFLLVKDLTGNFWASLFSGLIFSFNPYHWGQLPHLQLMPFFWAPLALLFANRFLKNRNYSDFWKTLFFTWMQYYASIYLGTMLLTTLIIVFLAFLLLELEGWERLYFLKNPAFLKNCLFGVIVGAIVLLPIGIPYLKVAAEWNFFRTIDENIVFSSEPFSVFFPNAIYANYAWLRETLFNYLHGDKYETAVFIGVLPLVFSLIAFLFRKKEVVSSHNKIILRYVFVSVVLFLIMLGPILFVLGRNTGIPMPFLLVHKLIPGGEAMRVPSRFILPMLLAVSILCGFGFCIFQRFLDQFSLTLRNCALVGVAIILIFDYEIRNFKGVTLKSSNDFPPVYKYLSKASLSSPVLELPFYSWAKFKYLHYQTKHWRPKVGGFSGWVPPTFGFLNDQVQSCPKESCARLLQIVPFDSLVVHLDRIPSYKRKKFETWNLKPYGFYDSKRIGNDLVWERNKEKSVPLTRELKIDDVYVESDDYGMIVILVLGLDDQKGWRIFSRDSEIDITIKTKDSKSFKTKKKVMLPHYFLSSEYDKKIVKIFTRLGKASNEISSIKIEGKYIQGEELDFKNLRFLKDEKTSKKRENNLKAEWSFISGIQNHSEFIQGEMIEFRGLVKNVGNAIWLDQSLNSELYDSIDGSVYSSIQVLERNAAAPCDPKDKVLDNYQIPIKNIITPNNETHFNLHIPAPLTEGDYALSLGLEVKDGRGFRKIEGNSKKCFEFVVNKSKNSMSFGDLARFFGPTKTSEDKASMDDFRRMSRYDQEEKILYLAEFIKSNGGLNAAIINHKNIHLWEKVLEIAEFLENKT